MIKYYENLSLENLSYINEDGLVCWEEFRDIPEYEGLYQVSNLGRVKCIVTSITDKNNITKNITIKILKLCFDSDGYLLVGISKNKKRLSKRVHRLVMSSFIEKSDLQVDHIDEIKWNNTLSKLRYCTCRQNIHFYCTKEDRFTSSFAGVYKRNDNNKWRAGIKINQKVYHLGVFDSQNDANSAYADALYNWENFGTFPKSLRNYTSSYEGVSFDANSKKWIARPKRVYLGSFLTEEDAYIIICKYNENLVSS